MTMVTPIRVLLVEDHPMVRQALRTILHAFSGVSIIGESTTGQEAVLNAGTLRPDIVLMDVNIPQLDGIAATRTIKTRYPHIAVIGLTCHMPGYTAHAMINAGAFDVVLKENALNLYEVMERALAYSPLIKSPPMPPQTKPLDHPQTS